MKKTIYIIGSISDNRTGLPVRDVLKLCPGGEFGTEDWSEKL